LLDLPHLLVGVLVGHPSAALTIEGEDSMGGIAIGHRENSDAGAQKGGNRTRGPDESGRRGGQSDPWQPDHRLLRNGFNRLRDHFHNRLRHFSGHFSGHFRRRLGHLTRNFRNRFADLPDNHGGLLYHFHDFA